MKAMKILIGVLVGLVVLVGVALVVIPMFIDPNEHKGFVAEKVKDVTGRDLVFDGDLELSVFPWIAVKTGTVILGNAEGFGDLPMVRLESASVGLKLMPLLSGSFEISDVAVDGLQLNLMKNKEGVTNWDDLASGAKEDKPAESAEADAGEKKPLNISVGGVNISNADITWDDQQSGKKYAVNGANVTLGELEMGKPFDFTLALGVSSAEPQADARIEAKGNLAYDLETKKLVLAKPTATVAASGKAVPGGKADVEFSASSLDLDLTGQVLALREFVLSVYGVDMVGTITGKSFMDNPTLAGDMTVKPFNVKNTLGMLGIKAPETSDPEALSKVGAQLKFSYLPDAFEAQDVTVNLDQTTATAKIKVEGFSSPAIYLRARVDDIDVDRYLPPKQEGAAAQSASAEETPVATGEGPTPAEQNLIDQIRKLNVDAAVVIDKLKASGMNMADVKVRLLAKDGVLNITPASLDMYQGNISTTTRLDATGSRLRTAANLTVAGLELGPMLRDFVGDKGFEGTMQFRTTKPVTFTGLDEPTAVPTLNGAIYMRLLDGVFPGVDLSGFLGDSQKLQEERADKLVGSPEDRTEFGELSASAMITNGVVDNQDMCLKAPHLRASGEGMVDGVKKEVDYLVTAMLIPDAEGQGGITCDDAVGIGMPVRVTGSLFDPSFGVDAGEFLAMVARGPLRMLEAGFGSLGSAMEGLSGVTDTVEQLTKDPAKAVEQVIEQLAPAEGSGSDGNKADSLKQVEDALKGFGLKKK